MINNNGVFLHPVSLLKIFFHKNLEVTYTYTYIYIMKVKEAKKPMTVLVKPSTKKKAQKKAAKENKSLSELVETLLYEYAE